MRYYLIEISNPGDAPGSAPLRRYSSLSEAGVSLRGALQIEMDIPVSPFSTPAGAGFLRIYGIPLGELSQASDMNGKQIRIYGGMTRGLPLANPSQSGLLIEGIIQQAFGNWIGTDMTLDFVLQTDGGYVDDPKNIVLPWRAGQPLAEAISTALSVGFPTYRQSININPALVLPHDEPGYYQTVTQFAQYVKTVSQNILRQADYPGVEILVRENEFIVYDGTQRTDPKQILFTDLIGQPTWIGFSQVQFKTVMRADLTIGGYVRMPQGQTAIATPQSQSQYRSKSVFQSVFQLDSVRHLGNFKQASGDSWVTVFNMHEVPEE